MVPSWKISVQSGDMEPGRMPPISAKCAQVCEKPTNASSAKTGEISTWSGVWVTAPCEA